MIEWTKCMHGGETDVPRNLLYVLERFCLPGVNRPIVQHHLKVTFTMGSQFGERKQTAVEYQLCYSDDLEQRYALQALFNVRMRSFALRVIIELSLPLFLQLSPSVSVHLLFNLFRALVRRLYARNWIGQMPIA